MNCDPASLVLAARCDWCVPAGTHKEIWMNLLCRIANKGLTTPDTSPAGLWAARVVANGGAPPSDNTKTALNTFYNSLVTTDLVGRMIAVNCFVPDNLIASLTPLIKNAGNDPWTNHGFIGPGTDLSVNGLVGDAAAKYLETGVIPSAHIPADTSAGFTVYNTAAVNQNTTDLGCQNAGGTPIAQLVVSGFPSSSFWDCWNTTGDRINIANALWTGYLSGNRTASNATAMYKANSGTPHQSIASGANNLASVRPGVQVFCFAHNNNGTAINFSSHRLSFAAIHTGLLAVQSQNFYNAIQALRVSLLGGFV